MALTLRDVCLGIIELTHPDTKPVVGSRHRLDGVDISRQQHMLSHVFKVLHFSINLIPCGLFILECRL
jgi:hypothetical protein